MLQPVTADTLPFISFYIVVVTLIEAGAPTLLIGSISQSFFARSNALIFHNLIVHPFIVLTWRHTNGLFHIEALDVSDSHRFRRSQRRWGPRPEPIERRA